MSHDARQRMLHAALHEFDRAHRARTRRRSALAGVGTLCALALAAWWAWPAAPRAGESSTPGHGSPLADGTAPVAWQFASPQAGLQPVAAPRLPDVLEVIECDRDLARAMEAAGSTDGFAREGDRIVILPRAATPPSPGPSADAGQAPSAAPAHLDRDRGVPRLSPG